MKKIGGTQGDKNGTMGPRTGTMRSCGDVGTRQGGPVREGVWSKKWVEVMDKEGGSTQWGK